MKWRFKFYTKLFLNLLPIPYSFWRKFGSFRHDEMDAFDKIVVAFERLLAQLNITKAELKNKACLEVGSGSSFFLGILAAVCGAKKVYLVDVGEFSQQSMKRCRAFIAYLNRVGYITPDLPLAITFEDYLGYFGICHLTCGLESLSAIGDGEIDYHWSIATLEHIKKSEFKNFFRGLRRVCKRDALGAHVLDLKDHIDYSLNNLRYADWFWESSLVAKSGAYTNRVRWSQFVEWMSMSGFDIDVKDKKSWPDLPLRLKKMAPRFRAFTLDDLCVKDVFFNLRCNERVVAKNIVYFMNTCRFFLSHRQELAMASVRQGNNVTLIAPPDESTHKLMTLGIKYVPFAMSRGFAGIRSIYRSLRDLRDHFDNLQPDIIHIFSMKPILMAALASRKMKNVRIINAVTGLGYLFLNNRAMTRVARFVLVFYLRKMKSRQVKYIFQNSDDRLKFIELGIALPQSSILIKGSGVDVSRFVPVDTAQQKQRVLIACRLLWSKGVGIFAAAAALLKDRYPDVVFSIAGHLDLDNPNAISEKQLRMWEQDSNVEWLGFVNDMRSLLQKTRIFCLPSSYPEGVPKVLLEAASCGLPLISTNSPGCRDIVWDGVNGYLLSVNTPSELAKKISSLLSDEVLYANFSRQSRVIAEREFSLDSVIEKTVRLYTAKDVSLVA